MRPTVLTLILVAALAQALAALSIRVPSQQPTIQAGINAASTRDTVLVASGTYVENINFNGKRIKVIGEYGARATILKPAIGSDVIVRLINGEDSSTQLSGFTVDGGTGQCAIHIKNSTPRVSNNIITGYRGGTNSVAVYCDNANALITRNVFYDNTGISCIGIWTGTARIINNTFDRNARGFFSISGAGEARNNIVSNSTEYGVSGAFTTLEYNDVWNNNPNYTSGASGGTGSMIQNPLYRDATSRDYRLASGSPCINAGDPSPIYNDLDGTRNDMGASPGAAEGYPLPVSIIVAPSCGPTRVISVLPTISWQYVDMGTTQQGYEIQIGEDQNWTFAETWATGPVADTRMSVPYQGNPLIDGSRYYMRMRVYNGIKWGSWVEQSFIVWLSHRLRVPADYSTIQAAINTACSGDTILVSPGTYAENLYVNGKAVLILANGNPGEVALTPATATLPVLQFADCPDTTAELRGFTVLPSHASVGILLSGTGRPIIRNCVFRGYLSSDVVIRCEVADALITRNVFYDNLGISCVGIYSGTARIINNTFDLNNRGFFSVSGKGEGRNNIVTNSREYGIHGTFTALEYNDVWYNSPNYSSPAAPGVGSISLDPWYVSQVGRDYHIQSRSPCINSGDPAAQYLDPNGSRNDIGAYPGNIAPILATIGPRSVAEGATLNFNVAASDPDGTVPSLTAAPLPANASFIDNANGAGSFTFHPDYTQAGSYNVTFRASDGSAVDTEVVTLTVSNTNRAPVLAAIGSKATEEGRTLTIGISAMDPDGAIPTLTTSSLPANASFIDNANGTGAFAFSPSFSQSGSYSITFRASDGTAIDSEIVLITVANVNQAPTLVVIGAKTVSEGELLTFDISATDFDGTIPILSALGLPDGATFADHDNGLGTFAFRPTFKQAGDYDVIFRASDGALVDSEVIRITVTNVPLPASVLALKTDGMLSPRHLLNHAPLFQWSYQDPELVGQSFCEIEVGTDNDWQDAEAWDPPPLASADTFAVYEGEPLLDGRTYYIRLRVYTDQVWSAWYEDSLHMNAAPSVPLQRSPINWAIAGNTPALWVSNAVDPEGDAVVYEFAGFNDTDCVAGEPILLTGVPGGSDSTGGQIVTSLAENCLYWWRVRAFDGFEYSDWSPYGQFWVNGTPEVPMPPQLQTPPSGAPKPLYTVLPTMRWAASYDPDPLDTILYRLEISLFPNFSFILTVDSLSALEWTATDSLQFGTHFWWRVTAKDKTGLSAVSSVYDFWTWQLGDVNNSHRVDLTDLSILVAYLLGTGGEIQPKMLGDVNGDCRIDLIDLSTIITHLLGNGGHFRPGC